MHTTHRFAAFTAFAVGLLAFLGYQVHRHETTLREGMAFHFKCAPVDPSDPFRGKYVRLAFEANQGNVYEEVDLSPGKTVYVVPRQNEEGFAEVAQLWVTPPPNTLFYIKSKVVYHDPNSYLTTVEYPFGRLYMAEDKAAAAEKAYWKALSDPDKKTYAVVRVRDGGEAVLEDVMLDGRPIAEVATEFMRLEE